MKTMHCITFLCIWFLNGCQESSSKQYLDTFRLECRYGNNVLWTIIQGDSIDKPIICDSLVLNYKNYTSQTLDWTVYLSFNSKLNSIPINIGNKTISKMNLKQCNQGLTFSVMRDKKKLLFNLNSSNVYIEAHWNPGLNAFYRYKNGSLIIPDSNDYTGKIGFNSNLNKNIDIKQFDTYEKIFEMPIVYLVPYRGSYGRKEMIELIYRNKLKNTVVQEYKDSVEQYYPYCDCHIIDRQ